METTTTPPSTDNNNKPLISQYARSITKDYLRIRAEVHHILSEQSLENLGVIHEVAMFTLKKWRGADEVR